MLSEYDSQLKPCAYCGGSLKLILVPTNRKYCISCTQCTATLGLLPRANVLQGYYDTPEAAICSTNVRFNDGDDVLNRVITNLRARVQEKAASRKELSARWGAWSGFIRELDAQISELRMFANRFSRWKTGAQEKSASHDEEHT
jgi:hypothetical protein